MNASGGAVLDSVTRSDDRCSFCDRTRAQVATMLSSESGLARICDRCSEFATSTRGNVYGAAVRIRCVSPNCAAAITHLPAPTLEQLVASAAACGWGFEARGNDIDYTCPDHVTIAPEYDHELAADPDMTDAQWAGLL